MKPVATLLYLIACAVLAATSADGKERRAIVGDTPVYRFMLESATDLRGPWTTLHEVRSRSDRMFLRLVPVLPATAIDTTPYVPGIWWRMTPANADIFAAGITRQAEAQTARFTRPVDPAVSKIRTTYPPPPP